MNFNDRAFLTLYTEFLKLDDSKKDVKKYSLEAQMKLKKMSSIFSVHQIFLDRSSRIHIMTKAKREEMDLR